MSKADGVLTVVLTHEWFDMIASGEKLEEYRAGTPYWMRRLLVGSYNDCSKDIRNFHTLRAQRAYTGVWLERKINRIRWGTPRPEWSGNTVTGDCFIIELEPLP